MAIEKAAVDRHIAQWHHNRALIEKLPASHSDWVVTAAFYTAVHAIDAALAHEGHLVSNHEKRFEALAFVNRLAKPRQLLHTLYNLSRTARYSADPSQWIAPRRIEPDEIRGRLYPLEQSIQKLIGRNLNLPLLDLSHLGASPPPAV